MPNVVRLASQAHGRYRVVTVNVTHIDQLQGARQFARQFHLPQPVLLDPTGRIQQAYLVSVLPTTYYLNAKGVVVAQVLGAETFGAMSRHLAQAGVRPVMPLVIGIGRLQYPVTISKYWWVFWSF